MKRIAGIFIILIFLYSTYYDLTIGTLPSEISKASEPENEQKVSVESTEEDTMTEEPMSEPFQAVTVEPGNTVLSIVEHLHEGPYPATIQDIIYDFKELNGIEPEEMQIGEEYLFPLYQ
ncbi:hypothetical protein [Bacillus suaedae]|uniref:LysM domain-containing protein n=1 Tax=Halalkalibacter suaedae TaxID=2822140 RepID=A0A940WZ60_9BACI|nr:hypothetical protein [Bacillus suaedae]MBP3951261.1 hypothetical protein [Bacillus suaedae]